MTRLSTITDALKRQLEAHGYRLTDVEIKDVAAHVVMALDEHDAEQLEAKAWRPTDGAS